MEALRQHAGYRGGKKLADFLKTVPDLERPDPNSVAIKHRDRSSAFEDVEPVGREGTTLGAHATVADALHVVGRRLGPQLNHSNGGVPPGADQSQETTLAAVAADALDT